MHTVPRLPRRALFSLLFACLTVACSSAPPGDAIASKVASSVGQRFSETNHSRPTGAVMRMLRDDGKLREYEYQWKNGCAYALLVDAQTDVILSWRYISSAEPCRRIQQYTFGT